MSPGPVELEGSIAEGNLVEECVIFHSRFLIAERVRKDTMYSSDFPRYPNMEYHIITRKNKIWKSL